MRHGKELRDGGWLRRAVEEQVIERFIECGDPHHGFARICCDACAHDYLLAYSCKTRYFCPSCHQKRVLLYGEWVEKTVLAPVPHRQYVFTLPRLLRPIFGRHRPWLGELCRIESALNLMGGPVDYGSGPLGIVAPHWKAGKIRILAITAPRRLDGEYAQIPTWREQGIDVVVANSRYMMAPPGLSAAQVAYWDGIFRKTVASPEWRNALAHEQWVDQHVSSADLRALIGQHYAQAREILSDLGMAKGQ